MTISEPLQAWYALQFLKKEETQAEMQHIYLRNFLQSPHHHPSDEVVLCPNGTNTSVVAKSSINTIFSIAIIKRNSFSISSINHSTTHVDHMILFPVF